MTKSMLIPEHIEHLESSAIDIDLARSLGVYSATTVDELPETLRYLEESAVPGIVFPWTFGDRVVHQLRPDHPVADASGKLMKYVFTSRRNGGGSMIWTVHDPDGPVLGELLVEGTKQALAVASLRPNYRVHALAGCTGWYSDGLPIPELDGLARDRDLFVILDADMKSNPSVHDAAAKMLIDLPTITGAKSIKIASTPGTGFAGIDDLLATRAPEGRAAVLDSVLGSASGRLPKKPPKTARVIEGPLGGAFDNGEFQPYDAALIMDEDRPTGFQEDAGVLWRYAESTGAYSRIVDLGADLAELLRNEFKQGYVGELEGCMIAIARGKGRIIDTLATPSPLVPLGNGVLDPATGELSDHDPKHLLLGAWPTEWIPDAECPRILDYIDRHFPEQVDPLLDTASRILERRDPQDRSLFIFGPPRSGKSTILRLFEELVGPDGCSAETLHDLTSSTWSTAQLLGKSLNVAADISSAELQDTARFKAATGGDVLSAQRKYEQLFTFTNHALMAFSANTIPTLPAEGGAELARFVPIAAPASFEGHEDPQVEAELMEELPGLLVELVRRYQSMKADGRQPQAALPVVREEFRRRSDRVFRFAEEVLELMDPATPHVRGTDLAKVHQRFTRWAGEDGSFAMSRPKFTAALAAAGIPVVRSNGTRVMATLRSGTPVSGQEFEEWCRWVNMPSEQGLDSLDTVSENFRPETVSEEESESTEPVEFVENSVQTVQPLVDDSAALTFDLETGPAERLFTAGPDFIRIAATSSGNPAGVDAIEEVVRSDQALVAHNGFGFDFVALARHREFDLLAASEADRLIDTRVLARLADPPPDGKTKGDPRLASGYYGLDATAERLGVTGKVGDLKALAREFSPTKKWEDGLDQIPVDDPRYLAYVQADTDATVRVLDALNPNDYARREMKLLGRLVTGITVTGFRVDVSLLTERVEAGRSRQAERIRLLGEKHGVPMLKANGGLSAKPWSTGAGKAHLLGLFESWGVPIGQMTTTDNGNVSLGSDAMTALADHARRCDDEYAAEIVELAELIAGCQSERTIYDTINGCLVGDRVHPRLDARQASGRFSVTDPGLTVIGKQDGKHIERDVLIAEPGHVIRAFDQSQIDARAVAALSQCPDYMERFTGGRDLHQEVADALGLADRSDAKPFSHGFPYGMGAEGMVRNGLDRELSENYIEYMHDTFPRLCQWMEEARAEAEANEFLDNGFGRLMRPDPSRGYTQGPALMGQGCARDLMAESVLRLPVEVVPMIRMWAHDEIVMSIPEARVEEVSAAVLDAMQFDWRGVEILGDESPIGSSWGEVSG